MVRAEQIAPRDRQPKEAVAMSNTQRIAATGALILSLAAAAGPAAARPADGGPDNANATIAAAAANEPATQPIVRIQTPQSGFDWGDAGIGAAGGLALAALGYGGVVLISHQRPRRTGRTTAVPN
jgi:hypothetical protein